MQLELQFQAQAGLTGPTAFESPYQQAVRDATLAEFDELEEQENKRLKICKLELELGVVAEQEFKLAEYQTKSDLDRARLLAQLNQAGFTQAQPLAAQQFGQQTQLAQLQLV